jgi:glycosyltransferase involved in cell wall biosynthesis
LAISCGANPRNTYVIPGFIPPRLNETQGIPEKINDFLKVHSVNMLMAGVVSGQTERDIYGIWDTLYIFKRIKDKYKDIGLIIFLQQKQNANSIAHYLNENKLSQNVLVHTDDTELWPTMRRCEVYLRPTKTDGDANSIREALFFGIPVLASDCVQRPDPVVIYKTGDLESYYDKLDHVINNIETYKISFKRIRVYDNSTDMINILKKLKST